MKFILVEDDIKAIEKVKAIICDVIFPYNIDYKIIAFNKCNSKLKDEINDLTMMKTYILSVDLKQDISGIDIAEYIREKDWDSNIIFLTKHGNMFETAHRKVCNVFEFIEKYQNMNKRLTEDIKKIIIHSCDHKMFTFSCSGSDYKIYYKSIKYINRNTNTRKLVIHTENKTYNCNMTIKMAMEKLDKRFIRVSKSTIINNDYICEINWNKGYAILTDDTLINSISKKYK